MNPERPAPEELPRQNQGDDSRERNGTGAGADQEQLGITEEEVGDLEDDAAGG
jgi:hypothetical protein